MILRGSTNNIELHHFNVVDKNSIAQDYLAWLNDIEVVKSIGSPILLKSKSLDFIDESYKRFTAGNCQGFFIKENGKFIGTAKIDKIDSYNNSAEIGIMIGDKSRWGKGVATEVYKILMDYAFNKLNLHRLWGGTSGKNIAMQKTFLKLGFKEEGILRDYSLIDGEYVDNHQYGILAKEYFQNK